MEIKINTGETCVLNLGPSLLNSFFPKLGYIGELNLQLKAMSTGSLAVLTRRLFFF